MFVCNLSLGRVWWIDNQCDLFIFLPLLPITYPPSPTATRSFVASLFSDGWSAHPIPFGRNVDDVTVWLLARLPSLCTLYYMMTTSLSLSAERRQKGRKDEEKSWLGCGPSDDDVVRHTHTQKGRRSSWKKRSSLVGWVSFFINRIENQQARFHL
jgi:hypothetical protein